MDEQTREIVGVYIGKQDREVARKLWLSLLGVYRQCAVVYKNFWEAYEQVIPTKRHRAVRQKTCCEIVNNGQEIITHSSILMLNIKRILRQDRQLRATTGINRKAFENLLVNFEQVYCSFPVKREMPRKKKIGAGRKARLRTMKQKLFYILFYFKFYPAFDLASVLFDE